MQGSVKVDRVERGLFADDAFATLEVCGTVDFGVALRGDVSFTFL